MSARDATRVRRRCFIGNLGRCVFCWQYAMEGTEAKPGTGPCAVDDCDEHGQEPEPAKRHGPLCVEADDEGGGGS